MDTDITIKTKRIFLFLFGCVILRLLLVYIVKIINVDYLPYLGYIALLPAFTWIYLFMFDKRKTGPEVFNQQIWWNKIRPIHAFLYILFAYNAINKNKNSYIYLLIDVLFGLSMFLIYHFTDYKIFT